MPRDDVSILDGPQGIARFIANSKAILLDFDGPVAELFPNGSSRNVADDVRGILAGKLPEEVAETKDPLELLRWIGPNYPYLLPHAEAIVCQGETRAAWDCEMTPHINVALSRLSKDGINVYIVSNNSKYAIEQALQRFGLISVVKGIYGRPTLPARMKPNPFLLLQAMAENSLRPDEVVMIGDSATDMKAAAAAEVPALGWLKRPDKAAELESEGAYAIIESVAELHESLSTN